MRTTKGLPTGLPEQSTVSSSSVWQEAQGPVTYRSYHEMADHPVVEQDAMSRLEENLTNLEGMSARFSFMMSEISYLMKIES